MNRIILQLQYTMKSFAQHFFSKKVGALLLLQFFILHIYLSPMYEFTLLAKYPISPWTFPFLFMNIYFNFFFMLGIIYYYSNVPFMQYSQVYQIIRTGRLRWGVTKIASIILSAFSLVLAEILLSILPLIRNIQLEIGWGKVLYTLSMTGAPSEYNINLDFPYHILSTYTPLQALGILILVDGLVISFIGILMFVISVCSSRIWAISIAMAFSVFPIAVINMSYKYKWMVYLSPISWMDLSMIGIKRGDGLPKVEYILGILFLIIVALTGLAIWRIRKIDFQWNKED